MTISAAAQEYAGREKLGAQSNEFCKEAIKVTDGVYVAVVYSASNVMLIQGDSGSTIVRHPPTQWTLAPARTRQS